MNNKNEVSEVIELFSETGYAVIDLLTEDEHDRLQQVCRDRMKDLAQRGLPGPSFDPWPFSDYHTLVTDEGHKELMAPATRYLTLDAKEQEMIANETTFPFLESHYGHHNVAIKLHLDEADVDGGCVFRFIRPSSTDVSGIHTETNFGWNFITLWIPLAGFDERYSLMLSPGSHLVEHPNDQIVINNRFRARPYSDEYTSKFDYVRPNMRKGQALIFHPNLLHGGSNNLGESTRVSVEVRLCED